MHRKRCRFRAALTCSNHLFSITNQEITVRHLLNVVSVGIFLGLSLFAIAVLTALYASPWQAAAIFTAIAGIVSSVSLYCGERHNSRALETQLRQTRSGAETLNMLLRQERIKVDYYASELEDTKAQLDDCVCEEIRDASLILVIHADELEEEPPLFI